MEPYGAQRPMSDASVYNDDNSNMHNNTNNRISTATSNTDAYDGVHAHGGDSRRESYVDPASPGAPAGLAPDDQLRRFHGVGGAYTTLQPAGHISSEPSSPTMLQQHDADGDSNGDSSSNGSTKVDSRSPSAYRIRGGNGYGLGGPAGSEVGSFPSHAIAMYTKCYTTCILLVDRC